jgi:subtilase family serine protease
VKLRAAAALLLVAVMAACDAPHPSTSPQVGREQTTPLVPIQKSPPSLSSAISSSADLGPAQASTTVSLSFALKVRNQGALDALLAGGGVVSAAEYASRFGPDPSAVRRAVEAIQRAGLTASWRPGSSLIAADGSAPAAAALLKIVIENYRLPDGSTFYAAVDQPTLPPAVAVVSSAVSGLDNYRRARGFAVKPGGLTPTDVLAYYNIKPLRDAGLDGKGQTIVLPEIDDLPSLSDLNKFASKYGLPPFSEVLTIKKDPRWGTPEKPQGETVLDLEIIHAVAPKAQLVVYISSADFGHTTRAFDQMVTDHLGSIISESLGSCESDTPSGVRNLYASVQDRALALGMSHFVASGDSGAFTCGADQDAAGSFPSTLPTLTAVGGTTVFESKEGLYFKEYAWGSPLDESGGGGGASHFYAIPDYQKNVAQSIGRGQRQVPDVSAAADPLTGFHIIFNGREGQAGGTSAAAPLWAATIALINQDLKSKGLREVGFANPALYWMGENQAKLNPKPFHDVTAGNNLGFVASAGWDFATGWGSMDAAALDAAWTIYIRSGGG